MSTISFQEFVSQFSNLRQHILQDNSHPAVAKPEKNPSFVDPSIEILSKDKSSQKPFIIISAPGAVGKSTLAKQLCAEINAYYWNLSKTQLGSYTFRGTIGDAFGVRDSEVLADLATGNTIFVLDAFDEAEILSGWRGVEIFIQEAWRYVNSSPKTSIIMLARYETAQYIQLLLEELGQGKAGEYDLFYDSYQIQYFDSEKAKMFVRVSIQDFQSLNSKNLLQKHSQSFDDVVLAVFSAISQVFGVDYENAWNRTEVSNFLGYAPVLQSIARYVVNLGNDYQKALKKIERFSGINDGANLLKEFLDDLLVREQLKLINTFKEGVVNQVPREWNQWDKLYTPFEQIRRIFSYIQGIVIIEEPIMPNSIAEVYKERVGAFLPQHPFLREKNFAGPAFRDFVYAQLLTNPSTRRIAESVISTDYVPTPLLAQFYRLYSQNVGSGAHTGVLYESVIAGQNNSSEEIELEIVPSSEYPDDGVHQMIMTLSGSRSEQTKIMFEIDLIISDDDPVLFARRLRHASIIVNGHLSLGVDNREFEISDTEISCKHLTIGSQRLFVRSSGYNEIVQIEAERFNSVANPVSSIKRSGDAKLSVSWPGSNIFPWYEYNGLVVTKADNKIELMQALRRILSWFRRDRRVEFARYAELIDNVAVGKDPVRKNLLKFLMDQGVISYKSPLYYYYPDVAQAYGLNWADLRNGTLNDNISLFLDSFSRIYDKT